MFAKFGSHRSYGNRNIISYISSYMNTLEKIARTALVRHFENFQIMNTDLQQLSHRHKWRKKPATRRRTQGITKRYVFYANAKITWHAEPD